MVYCKRKKETSAEMTDLGHPEKAVVNEVDKVKLNDLIKAYHDADQECHFANLAYLKAYTEMISFGFTTFNVKILIKFLPLTNQFQFTFVNPGIHMFLDCLYYEFVAYRKETTRYYRKEMKKNLLGASLMLIIKGVYGINIADVKTSQHLVEKLISTKDNRVDLLLTGTELQEILYQPLVTDIDHEAMSFVSHIIKNCKKSIKALFIASGDNGKVKNRSYTSNVFTTKTTHEDLAYHSSTSSDNSISPDQSSIMGSSDINSGSPFSSPLSNRQLSFQSPLSSLPLSAEMYLDEDISTGPDATNSTAATISPDEDSSNTIAAEMHLDEDIATGPDVTNSTAATISPDEDSSNTIAAEMHLDEDIATGLDAAYTIIPDEDVGHKNYAKAEAEFFEYPRDTIIQLLRTCASELKRQFLIDLYDQGIFTAGANVLGDITENGIAHNATADIDSPDNTTADIDSVDNTTTEGESADNSGTSLTAEDLELLSSYEYATRKCVRCTTIDENCNLQYNEDLKTLNEESAVRSLHALNNFDDMLLNRPDYVIELLKELLSRNKAPKNRNPGIGSSLCGGSDIHIQDSSVEKVVRPVFDKYGKKAKQLKIEKDSSGDVSVRVGWVGCGRCEETMTLLWNYEFDFDIVFEIVELDIEVVESCYHDKNFMLLLCFRNALNNGKNRVLHRWGDGLNENFEFTKPVDILYSMSVINALAYYGFLQKAEEAIIVIYLDQMRTQMNAARKFLQLKETCDGMLQDGESLPVALAESGSGRKIVCLNRGDLEYTQSIFEDLYVSSYLLDIHYITIYVINVYTLI